MSRLHLVMLAALLALVHCTQATNLVHNVRLATTGTCDNHVQSLLNVTEVHWQPAKTGTVQQAQAFPCTCRVTN